MKIDTHRHAIRTHNGKVYVCWFVRVSVCVSMCVSFRLAVTHTQKYNCSMFSGKPVSQTVSLRALHFTLSREAVLLHCMRSPWFPVNRYGYDIENE